MPTLSEADLIKAKERYAEALGKNTENAEGLDLFKFGEVEEVRGEWLIKRTVNYELRSWGTNPKKSPKPYCSVIFILKVRLREDPFLREA